MGSPHTRTTAKSNVKLSNHHSFKDPHEALLQRTIQLHQNALATLRKDLCLDDADTLTSYQNKLKQAPNDLVKSQTKKKQDKLVANVPCDHGDDGVPAGQNLGSMWNYLRKSLRILSMWNYLRKSLRTLRILYHLKLAPTHPLMPESGRAILSIYILISNIHTNSKTWSLAPQHSRTSNC